MKTSRRGFLGIIPALAVSPILTKAFGSESKPKNTTITVPPNPAVAFPVGTEVIIERDDYWNIITPEELGIPYENIIRTPSSMLWDSNGIGHPIIAMSYKLKFRRDCSKQQWGLLSNEDKDELRSYLKSEIDTMVQERFNTELKNFTHKHWFIYNVREMYNSYGDHPHYCYIARMGFKYFGEQS